MGLASLFFEMQVVSLFFRALQNFTVRAGKFAFAEIQDCSSL